MAHVGESAALFRAVQPDAAFDLAPGVTEQLEQPRWRTGARGALSLVAWAIPVRSLRARHYRAQINKAYREGMRKGRESLAELAKH